MKNANYKTVAFESNLAETGHRAFPSVIACLGSSSTAGRGQAFNWIEELAHRPQNRGLVFRNFGVGGDLAYNIRQRVSNVIASEPRRVVILVGGNDALALASRRAGLFFRITKHLPVKPSPEWFRENLLSVARTLKEATSSRIGLCSLVPIGEDPSSQEPFQCELNLRIAQYSQIIKEVSYEAATEYIAVYEAIWEQLLVSPGRSLSSFQFLPMYRDAFRTLVLGKSPDDVARLNGWNFHSDGIHLNSAGGRIVANLVQEFIDS
jgi:lysophospholipase L1-like esterase